MTLLLAILVAILFFRWTYLEWCRFYSNQSNVDFDEIYNETLKKINSQDDLHL